MEENDEYYKTTILYNFDLTYCIKLSNQILTYKLDNYVDFSNLEILVTNLESNNSKCCNLIINTNLIKLNNENYYLTNLNKLSYTWLTCGNYLNKTTELDWLPNYVFQKNNSLLLNNLEFHLTNLESNPESNSESKLNIKIRSRWDTKQTAILL